MKINFLVVYMKIDKMMYTYLTILNDMRYYF